MENHPLYLTATDFIEKEVHIVQQFIGQIFIHIATVTACHHSYGDQPVGSLHSLTLSFVMTQLIGQCIEQYIAIAQQFDIFIGLASPMRESCSRTKHGTGLYDPH